MSPFELTNDGIRDLFGWRLGRKLTLQVEEVECVNESAQDEAIAAYRDQGWTVIKAGEIEGSEHFFLRVVRRQTKPSKEYPLMTAKELLQKAYD